MGEAKGLVRVDCGDGKFLVVVSSGYLEMLYLFCIEQSFEMEIKGRAR